MENYVKGGKSFGIFKVFFAGSCCNLNVAANCGSPNKEKVEKETSRKRILQRELGFEIEFCSLGEGKMGSRLQQVLRSLCLNTGWKYAVFWKLRHRARMMFTWEDAYYDSSQYPDKMWFNATACSMNEGPYSHDPLGLAVAKMSYQVYSLGEGVVGQVAVSGKHSWIFSDQIVVDSSSSSELCGGWQTQFSAGIKTIAVVAVIPHGVVQLGSLHKIAEDLKLIDHIRNVFVELQDSLVGCIPSSIISNKENSCLSDTCTRISDPAVHDCVARFKGSFHEDEESLWSQLFPPLGESGNHSHNSPKLGSLSNRTLRMKMHEGRTIPGNEISLPSSSENILTRQPRQEEMESLDSTKYVGEMNDFRDLGKRPDIMCTTYAKNDRTDKSDLCNATLPADGSQTVPSNLPLEMVDSPAFQDKGDIHVLEFPNLQLHQDFENLELPAKSDRVDMRISPFSFCAGYELYEALGPSFQKKNDCAWEAGKAGSEMAIEISEGMGSCSLLMENSDMHLLDAVVAKVSHKGGTISSAGYSFERDTSSSLNSMTRGVESLKGCSSTSSSRGSEHLERPREAVKINKKRARPGESCRPRPRDRQLIQDRIKELRDLVPNGSKCSIDSLLERTIKHMLFLQSVTKHAEKLHKCSASKLLDKDTGMRRFSSCEQGSSWAVEVGNNQKVCPIIVENISMNGQMLVEMLCEECSQFLEIAETIRSLGLTILKGVSEAYGNKTWMCFVVEAQNNRSMHRMDVLWSLMQLLQPKTSA
ncbi:Transcription factor [Sesamum alatum]|uniref:Transcription factor n=1 Tax=Sesamum alatum TaxID=300844 RepID=A0AAE1XVM3_9LAMI|nr:Transcription factor [Sesamum alatum]